MAFDKEFMEKLHAKALKQFEAIQDAERESRKLAVEDMRFVNVEGAQWEDDFDKRADKPRPTINRVAGLVDQVTGAHRQDRSSIKYVAMSDDASNEVADIKSGMARNIENESDATTVYDMAFDETVTGGYGGWRVLTEFEDEGFDQVIRLSRIRSAATCLFFDVNASAYDKRDAKHAFLIEDIHPHAFEEDYPEASKTNFPVEDFSESWQREWFRPENVRTAEYWWKEPCVKNIALLSDGRIIDKDEEAAVLDELQLLGITIERERKVETHKVYMAKMNGHEFLSEAKEFPSKFIGLVPEYGKVTNIEGQCHIRGLTRFSKDPQRIYNYATSAAIEAAASVPKDPYFVTPAQVKGYESQYENFNVQNNPFMFFNPDGENPGIPQRGGAPQVQQAILLQIAQAEQDIYATSNIYPPSLGMNPTLQSGVALKHQDEKGDRGAFIFTDNHLKSIRYTGEIISDMIPRVYDKQRMVRILNLDGTVEMKEINKIEADIVGVPVIDRQTGKEVIVNDLTAGKYGTTVDTAPAYRTQKMESFTQLVELSAASPIFAQLATDLIAKNLNALEAGELHKRIRKQMVMSGTIDPTEEEIEELGLDQPKQPDPAQQAITDNLNMDTEKKKGEIMLNDAKESEAVAKTQQTTIDAYKTLIEAYEKQIAAGIQLTQTDLNLKMQAQAMIELANEKVKV